MQVEIIKRRIPYSKEYVNYLLIPKTGKAPALMLEAMSEREIQYCNVEMMKGYFKVNFSVDINNAINIKNYINSKL